MTIMRMVIMKVKMAVLRMVLKALMTRVEIRNTVIMISIKIGSDDGNLSPTHSMFLESSR